MNPKSRQQAFDLLRQLGAPTRLLQHAILVGEAAESLLDGVRALGLSPNVELVRIGVVLHDVGKILHPGELSEPGARHETAGEALLLSRNVSTEIARICVTHADWHDPNVSLDELLVALADKLWKGSGNPNLRTSLCNEWRTPSERIIGTFL